MQNRSNAHERRWSRHGWNNRVSLYLIRTLAPRIPHPFISLTHWLMTAVCYVAMGHERRASIANLRQICAEDGLRLRRRSFSLFYNFSRFMVARMEMKNLPEQSITERVVNLPEARAALERALALGSGAVVATAHLGNWEMGVRLLKLSGRKVHIVMMADGVGDIESEYERSRAMEGLKVHWIGEDPFVGAELLSALRDGELVAVQADRNAGAACVTLPLFGAPVQLPLGPATLARAADVPILPCYVLMEDGHHLRLRIDPPIQVRRTSNAREDLYQATLELSRSIEAAVAERPEQWFNFYPIWEKACAQP